jgi:hypothetical protein
VGDVCFETGTLLGEQFTRTFAAKALKLSERLNAIEMSQLGVEASTELENIAIGTMQGHVEGPMGPLVQRCSSCGRMMRLGEGDTLFGDKWFHGLCWTLEADGKR